MTNLTVLKCRPKMTQFRIVFTRSTASIYRTRKCQFQFHAQAHRLPFVWWWLIRGRACQLIHHSGSSLDYCRNRSHRILGIRIEWKITLKIYLNTSSWLRWGAQRESCEQNARNMFFNVQNDEFRFHVYLDSVHAWWEYVWRSYVWCVEPYYWAVWYCDTHHSPHIAFNNIEYGACGCGLLNDSFTWTNLRWLSHSA